jgi:hypothetical protein
MFKCVNVTSSLYKIFTLNFDYTVNLWHAFKYNQLEEFFTNRPLDISEQLHGVHMDCIGFVFTLEMKTMLN